MSPGQLSSHEAGQPSHGLQHSNGHGSSSIHSPVLQLHVSEQSSSESQCTHWRYIQLGLSEQNMSPGQLSSHEVGHPSHGLQHSNGHVSPGPEVPGSGMHEQSFSQSHTSLPWQSVSPSHSTLLNTRKERYEVCMLDKQRCKQIVLQPKKHQLA